VELKRESEEVFVFLQACMLILGQKFDIDQMCNLPQRRRFMKTPTSQGITGEFRLFDEDLDEPSIKMRILAIW
jgi:hypothetical protein